jgi:hypothetical protein
MSEKYQSSNKTFFYIICRDRHVFEIEFTEQRFKDVSEMFAKKEAIALPSHMAVINSVDISKIVGEEEYLRYVNSAKPKEYLHRGTWYETASKQILRREAWKQLELDNHRLLLEKKEEEYKSVGFELSPEIKKLIGL